MKLKPIAASSLRVLAIPVLIAALPLTAVGADSWVNGKTPDGQPDLQGVWDFRTVTPLQRPSALADKAVLTAEEAAAFEQDFARGLGGGDLFSILTNEQTSRVAVLSLQTDDW